MVYTASVRVRYLAAPRYSTFQCTFYAWHWSAYFPSYFSCTRHFIVLLTPPVNGCSLPSISFRINTTDQCSSRPEWLLWMVDCTYIHLIELTLWHVLASHISSPLQQLISSITYLVGCFRSIQKKRLLSAKSAFNTDHNSKIETIQSSFLLLIIHQSYVIWIMRFLNLT